MLLTALHGSAWCRHCQTGLPLAAECTTLNSSLPKTFSAAEAFNVLGNPLIPQSALLMPTCTRIWHL